MQEKNTNYTPSVYPADKPTIERPKKAIPTFLGIAIVVAVAILLFGGAFAWQYFAVQTSNQISVVQPENPIAGWKTYTSSKLSVSFKYPNSWGDVKEIYYNSITDKKEVADSIGKTLSIYFTGGCYFINGACDSSRPPIITALSSDWSPYEWMSSDVPYKGDVSLQEIYNKFNNPKSEPIYSNIADMPAVQFITTAWDQVGSYDLSFQRAIEVYVKPNSGDFGGIQIQRKISDELKNTTKQEQADFINNLKNKRTDKVTQDMIDEFNLFLSTFKFIERDQTAGLPRIDSIFPNYGPVGTIIEVRGKNLAGFESDRNLWIKNDKGVAGILYGKQESTASLIKVSLNSPLCQTDESYRGWPCESWLYLTPGVYKIYGNPYGKKTNEVPFTITK